jgi:hypothetical protein
MNTTSLSKSTITLAGIVIYLVLSVGCVIAEKFGVCEYDDCIDTIITIDTAFNEVAANISASKAEEREGDKPIVDLDDGSDVGEP